MPSMNLGPTSITPTANQNPTPTPAPTPAPSAPITPSPTAPPAAATSGINTSQINGLSNEEYNDVNAIKVTIEDTQAPVVVLFGPPTSGKTMTLVRLARYLQEKNYVVTPVKSFRPSADTNYANMCNDFPQLIASDDAAQHTDHFSFMLVRVADSHGKTLCQILEGPGELYFDPNAPQEPFPPYFDTIANADNRKLWTVILEPDWGDPQDRRNYVNRIKMLKQRKAQNDSVCFVYNKIDKSGLVHGKGMVNQNEAIKQVKDSYNGIFEPFKNPIPILEWFQKYKCDFVPFQTGTYHKPANGSLKFTAGADDYPKMLWNIIYKRIIRG